ncbi:MAG: T9SS type A sorting domain-containing protein [Bacteroidetes bacterium]|nr:MAG: T9SS type A sorting domain-containing protein [Bacteroidota bacterium]
MKQKLLLLTLLFIFSISGFAKHVDENSAKQVGSKFIATKTSSDNLRTGRQLQLVYKSDSKSTKSQAAQEAMTFFYVFNVGSNGFVIVSGDDNVIPILGYSDQGTFKSDNLPVSVAKWMEDYKSEIRSIIEQDIPPGDQVNDAWTSLRSSGSTIVNANSASTVNPLVQTQWNQSPYENTLCPGGSVTGCVATGMAQIMKYWNYPATGSGFHSYNHQTYGTLSANFGNSTYQWSSMPNVLTSVNTAVGALMYDVGVSVDMSYSPSVSGAWVIQNSPAPQACSEYALKTYFGYKTSLSGVERVNYSDAQWMSLLKAELDASRPILYAGFGSGGGHCFVADGYDVNDFIHFNWGWGGAYDGYFHINALNPSGTGTGGGSGGYNSGHQAVVGIEPPTGTQTHSIALYNYVTPSSSTLYYGQAFEVYTNIVNNGTAGYSGDYAVAIFDDAYNFVDYVQILSGYTLAAGNAYINNLIFSNSGLFSMLPGTYYAGVYYRPTGGNWIQVSDNGSYSNFVQLTVINPNDIELNSSMSLTPGSTFTQGQSASVNLNIINDGINTFIGQYSVGLYNLDGSFSETIGTINENAGLPSGYTYLTPYLTFSTTAITSPPGTYLLAVQHNYNSTGWQLTGSSYFQNPIKVTVVASSIQPDVYEVNDILSQAYTLPVTFSGNNAITNTVGSNCHNTSDNDYYKILFQAGYNYTVTPRLHDSYNSGNGNTYTLDGLFSYSTDGLTWSDAFDDVISGTVAVGAGGTIYFRVAPFFAGETGTYLLDINVARASVIGVEENEFAAYFKTYPNPATNFIQLEFGDFSGKLNKINVLNVQGQSIYETEQINQAKKMRIPMENLTNGIYFLQLHTSSGLVSKKIVLTR